MLSNWLPSCQRLIATHPLLANTTTADDFSERELMYKFLFDMKGDLNELKKLVFGDR